MNEQVLISEPEADSPATIDAIIDLLRGVDDAAGADDASNLEALKRAARALAEKIAEHGGDDVHSFGAIERLIAILSQQKMTGAGFPGARPPDCARVSDAIEMVINEYTHLLRSGDPIIARVFDAMMDAFAKTDVKSYPDEYQRALMLWARARMVAGDARGTRQITQYYAERPYLIEAGFHPMLDLLRLDLDAAATLGESENLAPLALTYAVMLGKRDPLQLRYLGKRLANYIALGRGARLATRLERIAAALAGLQAGLTRTRGWPTTRKRASVGFFFVSWSLAATLGLLILWRRRGRSADGGRAILVTRAMGGIGDLLMMTPGFRALSRRKNRPIDVAVPRRFHAVFVGNPHVRLIDIEAAPIDLSRYDRWYNFTVCPAGLYEARHAPNIDRGRVEIYARALGVGRRGLSASGWAVQHEVASETEAFCRDFLRAAGFGGRPVIGVQPYARDSYKDHPGIAAIIEDLATRYDVLLFHHRPDGLPTGDRIASTAGLFLDKSLALVGCMDVMVSVDSAFLHAASAFDVPVVALFGPTDGKTFTAHHRHIRLLTAADRFTCAPCWRNEDIPCLVSGSTGPSPCLAALTIREVAKAVEAFLRERKNI